VCLRRPLSRPFPKVLGNLNQAPAMAYSSSFSSRPMNKGASGTGGYGASGTSYRASAPAPAPAPAPYSPSLPAQALARGEFKVPGW
jgi:hypothetical protein